MKQKRSFVGKIIRRIWHEYQGKKIWEAKMSEPLKIRIISVPDSIIPEKQQTGKKSALLGHGSRDTGQRLKGNGSRNKNQKLKGSGSRDKNQKLLKKR